MNFINFVRSQRPPVAKIHIQACVRQAATNLSIPEFKASNGWLQNFLRRSGVQSSFMLHGKGGTQLTSRTAELISEIKDQFANSNTRNIYNVDKSGLFCRMVPSRSYLSSNEQRKETRGTEFFKHKIRVTIIMCVNADGNHLLPVNYIGKSEHPICLRDSRCSSLSS